MSSSWSLPSRDSGPSAVASAADGSFVVVWSDNERGSSAVATTAGGVALGERSWSTTAFGVQQHSPAVAMSADGSFFVAWTAAGEHAARSSASTSTPTAAGSGPGCRSPSARPVGSTSTPASPWRRTDRWWWRGSCQAGSPASPCDSRGGGAGDLGGGSRRRRRPRRRGRSRRRRRDRRPRQLSDGAQPRPARRCRRRLRRRLRRPRRRAPAGPAPGRQPDHRRGHGARKRSVDRERRDDRRARRPPQERLDRRPRPRSAPT